MASSIDWCVLPSPKSERPQLEPQILDVGLRDGDAATNLVVGATDGEHREGAVEGNLAGQRQAGSGRRHILLGDSHLEVTLRISVLEQARHRRFAEVGLKHDDVAIALAELDQGLAVGHAQAFFSMIRSPLS